MPKPRPPTATTLSRGSADGKEVGNLILLALSSQDRAQLLPSLEFVRLKLHQVLHEAGDVIRSFVLPEPGIGFGAHSAERRKECGSWPDWERRIRRLASRLWVQNNLALRRNSSRCDS